jgi:hypothetical protein
MTYTEQTEQCTVERAISLEDLAGKQQWVAWREEIRTARDGTEKRTKIPYDPRTGCRARVPTDASTWGTRERAERRWRQLNDGRPGGVGIVLGELDDGPILMGIDLDGCFDSKTKTIEPWAKGVLNRFDTYSEVSPSGEGIKLFFLIAPEEYDSVNQLLGNKNRKAFAAGEHLEIAVDRDRFYAVTDCRLKDWPKTLSTVQVEDIRWLIEDVGPRFLENHGSSNRRAEGTRTRDESGSGYGFRFMSACKRNGDTYETACKKIRSDRGRAGEWARRVDERQLERAWKNGHTNDAETLEVLCVADVPMEQTNWVWQQRLARGKLTMMSGDPGLGKSQISMDIAARITNGNPWPDGGSAPRGTVVLLAAEDAVNDTIRPRLEAAGADTRFVHVVKTVTNSEGKKRGFELSADLDKLKDLIGQIDDDVVLIIVDPISAYMGDTDTHKMSLVSPVMSMVAEFAERNGVAVLAIHHPPKEAPRKALHAFNGTLAFVAGPRLVFLVVEDPENPDRSLLLPVKNNLGKQAAGMAYWIEDAAVDHKFKTSVIKWDDEPVTISANEALQGPNRIEPSKINSAGEFLLDYLADGPQDAKNVIDAGKEQNFSERTLHEAKKRRGIKSEKMGFDGSWTWRLPDRHGE